MVTYSTYVYRIFFFFNKKFQAQRAYSLWNRQIVIQTQCFSIISQKGQTIAIQILIIVELVDYGIIIYKKAYLHTPCNNIFTYEIYDSWSIYEVYKKFHSEWNLYNTEIKIFMKHQQINHLSIFKKKSF